MKLLLLIFIPFLLFAQTKEKTFTEYLTGMEARWTVDSLFIGHRITKDTMLSFPMSNLSQEERLNINTIWRSWRQYRDVFNWRVSSKLQVPVADQDGTIKFYRGRFVLREDRISLIDSSFVVPNTTRKSLSQAGGFYYWVVAYNVDPAGYQYLIDNKALLEYFVPIDADMDSLRGYLNDISSIPVWTTEEL